MNYFETKKVKLFKHVNPKPDEYGEASNPKLDYICDLMADVQPASAKLLEKEFGMVNEASFILWVESAPNKDFILDKDTYVKFEYENYENTYQVVDRSRWLDSFWDDDYTCFSVKLVDNYKELDMTNRPITSNLETNNTLNAHLENEDFKVKLDNLDNTEGGDDYYG